MKPINPKTFEPVYNKDGVTGRSMSKGDHFEIIHMTLQAKAYLAPHKTPFDAEFFTHKGNAVYIIDGEEINAEEGTVIECKGEVEHGIRNDTNEEITILIVKKLK